jgi:putative transposase
MDETYIRVKGEWWYVYRAVDRHGQTIDFLLTEQRDQEAALRFLTQAIRRHGVPEKITIDGNEANAAAIRSDPEAHGTHIIICQVKWATRPMLGFKSFDAVQGMLAGIELMHMNKKRQMVVEAGDEGLTAAV